MKEETTQKNYQDEEKIRNKLKINSQIKKPHLKMIPIKDKYKNSVRTRPDGRPDKDL